MILSILWSCLLFAGCGKASAPRAESAHAAVPLTFSATQASNALGHVAAFVAACTPRDGGTPEAAAKVLSSFTGAEGRYSVKGKYKGAVVVADYAHHPAAARATLAAASHIPHKKTWVIFQPLTYNRTEVLFDDFVRSLLPCEHVIFAEIFSDREINTGTVSSSMLADRINKLGGHAEFYADKKDIRKRLNELVGEGDLLLFLGPEDIREMADEIVKE